GSKELKPYYGCIYLKPPEQKSVLYLWFWNIGCDRMAVNPARLPSTPSEIACLSSLDFSGF
ncbi:hypothetical protein, partial [Cylindrospermopsis raciborskii]|uniref:hypothetical protein n=1 Tax=Cylindrospermopsis raciborskii TaxID=77022 RepID=UPI001F3B7283